MFVPFLFFSPSVAAGPRWHSSAAQALSAQAWSISRQGGWVLIIPYRKSAHHKPTTVPSRSNQEFILKRLWRSALHSPCVCRVCCILRQIFTHFVCKSLDQAAQQCGRGRFHSTSSQLPGVWETGQASVTSVQSWAFLLMPVNFICNALFEQLD